MNARARLALLEQQNDAPEVCPKCGAGSGKIQLLPIVYGADGRQLAPPDPAPCPACGVTPIRVTLNPMRLDGERQVNG